MKPGAHLCVTSPFEEALPRNMQEMTWKQFLKRGTGHSEFAVTLPYVMRRCERERIPYILKAKPGAGYWIEPWKDK